MAMTSIIKTAMYLKKNFFFTFVVRPKENRGARSCGYCKLHGTDVANANLRGGVVRRENMCLSLLWGVLFAPSHLTWSTCAQSVVFGICHSKPPAACAAC